MTVFKKQGWHLGGTIAMTTKTMRALGVKSNSTTASNNTVFGMLKSIAMICLASKTMTTMEVLSYCNAMETTKSQKGKTFVWTLSEVRLQKCLTEGSSVLTILNSRIDWCAKQNTIRQATLTSWTKSIKNVSLISTWLWTNSFVIIIIHPQILGRLNWSIGAIGWAGFW